MICFIIYLLAALIMVGIGVLQRKSKTPVGFYTGEKPPAAQELSDVSSWNKKHGAMCRRQIRRQVPQGPIRP